MIKEVTISIGLVLAACTGDDAAPPTPVTGAITKAPAAAPPAHSTSSNWRERVAADLATLAGEPALLRELTTLAPQTTRAGHLRFTTDAVHDPRAASVFLDRLARGGEGEGVRAALAEALPRTGGIYADAVVELLGTETSSAVREVYVHGARRAAAPEALAILRRGLADANAEVQAEAARTAAAHLRGAGLATELVAALASSEPGVRAEAARSLGILKLAVARESLAKLLGDGSADVRLEALRAIDRIAPGSLAGHAMLESLARDPDDRVARLAGKLAVRTR